MLSCVMLIEMSGYTNLPNDYFTMIFVK